MNRAQKILNKLTSSIMSIVFIGVNFMPVLAYATSPTQDTNELEDDIIFDVTINKGYANTENNGTISNDQSNAENNETTNSDQQNPESVETTNSDQPNTESTQTTDNNQPNTESAQATDNGQENTESAQDPNNSQESTESVETTNNDQQNTENNEPADGTHSYTANLEEKLMLKFNLTVKGSGYIKEATISINDNNYKIGEINDNVDEQNINNINQTDSGKIEIGQVNSENPLNFEIPIEFEKQDLMNIDYFDKNSKIQLNANYINDDGEQGNISKEINLHLKWDEEVNGYINQELKRYLKYDNKTLVSFLITDGIQDNKLPQLSKITQVLVPKIADQEPSKIIVTGDTTDYTYENQVLSIKSADEFSWNSSSEYLVTYIYDTQMDEGEISTVALMQAKTVNDKTVEVQTDEMSYAVKDEIGNLLDTSIKGSNEVNKGYLYANLNREEKLETSYGQIYQVNIGLVDFLDEIKIIETENEILTRKIMIDKDELVKILGEEGNIKILDKDGAELGNLNKDNVELEVNNNNLQYITSKPVQEGNINIYLNKVINPNMGYTKESLAMTNEFDSIIDVTGTYQGNTISNNHVVKKINLVEPSSNATISISQNNLSTVAKNEDVVITATLERNDITDALYTNPELLITLPKQITNVELKDAKLLYEDELKPLEFKTQGTQIYLKLDGTQTQYSSIPTANGTVIKIIADLTLDNLAVNSNEKVVLEYTNPARNEVKSVETPIQIVAPTGFVTANYGMQEKQTVAISNDEEFQIPANDVEKQITLKGTIVSNLEQNATGLSILGRVPSQGTKTVDGVNNDLNSTFTTNMKTPITVNGIDADIYYSENGEATYDLGNAENGWTLDANTNAKSYLIVAKSDVAPAQKIDFSYDINVPSKIDYENRAFSMFAVYYDNTETGGATKNIIVAKKINIETENIPIIRTEVTATDYYSGDAINYGDNVNIGSCVKYAINATNEGDKEAINVQVKIPRPEGTSFYIIREGDEILASDSYFDNSDEMVQTIDKINPKETKTVDVVLYVSTLKKDVNIVLRPEVTAENMLEKSTGIYENKTIDGTMILQLNTKNKKEEAKIDEEIEYRLEIDDTKGEKLKNVSVNIHIPDNVELVDKGEGEYDEGARELRFNIAELSWMEFKNFKVKIKSTSEPSEEMKLRAVGTYEGAEKEIKSNEEVVSVLDTKGFESKLESNIAERMLDTDTVEYYITVTNNAKKEAKVQIYDDLPQELKIERYIVQKGKEVKEEEVSLSPGISEKLGAGESIKVTIIAKPYRLNKVGDTKDIENKVSVGINGLDIETNSIKQRIEASSNFNTVLNEETKEEVEDKYSISGRVWYDENSNSKEEETEKGISNVTLKIYDINKQEYVKNKDGKEIEEETNEQGEYKFDNLTKGSYIVVANYDHKKYVIVNYQVNDLSQNENNDFIETQEGETSTNKIEIDKENFYNIDLGLTDVKNFNITVKNTIKKISIMNQGENKTYEDEKDLKKIEVNKKDKENTTVVIEYKIEVKNEGNVDGYAREILNEIPAGMKFISELNKDWYLTQDGEAINISIANKIIKVGETKELGIVLTKELNEGEAELIHNTAEVKETYNEYGIKEINAKSGQIQSGGGIADIVIKGKDVAKEVTIIIVTSLTIIGMLGMLGVGIYKRMDKK